MAYYIPCPACGANLDPGEECDCKNEKGAVPTKLGGSVQPTIRKDDIEIHPILMIAQFQTKVKPNKRKRLRR